MAILVFTGVFFSLFRVVLLGKLVSTDTVAHSRCYDARSDRGVACPDELAVAVVGYWTELFEGDPDRIVSSG